VRLAVLEETGHVSAVALDKERAQRELGRERAPATAVGD
jgi:hypothetical protein